MSFFCLFILFFFSFWFLASLKLGVAFLEVVDMCISIIIVIMKSCR